MENVLDLLPSLNDTAAAVNLHVPVPAVKFHDLNLHLGTLM